MRLSISIVALLCLVDRIDSFSAQYHRRHGSQTTKTAQSKPIIVSSSLMMMPSIDKTKSSSSSSTTTSSLGVAVSDGNDNNIDTRSFLLMREDVHPIIQIGKGDKEKIVNPFGLWCAVVSIITGPIWMLAMKLVHKMGENDTNRAMYDMTGKIWSKTWLTMTNSYPTCSGNLERLRSENDLGACLFVANHASWLDIPVLCTVLDPVFKFIAKGELKSVPCIGTQLVGGEHILIDREDRRSQLRTFKEGINWLKKGVPIMAFPEGQRSKDGHLMDFKGGLFAMAVKTNVPIVPITISHAHAVMPSNALFPIQHGAGKLHVHVHDAIDTTGKTEAELNEMVRNSFLSTLPLEQHPLEQIPSAAELEQVVLQQKSQAQNHNNNKNVQGGEEEEAEEAKPKETVNA